MQPPVIITEKIARNNHLWAWLMEPEERQARYQVLRLSGATASQAQRWRDWSAPHYEQILDWLIKTHHHSLSRLATSLFILAHHRDALGLKSEHLSE